MLVLCLNITFAGIELKTPLLTFKSILLAGGSSLLNCHKLPDVSD